MLALFPGLRLNVFASLLHSHKICMSSASIFIIISQLSAKFHLRTGDAMRRFKWGGTGIASSVLIGEGHQRESGQNSLANPKL